MEPGPDRGCNNVRIPLSNNSSQSSDDDFDIKDVVIRNPRYSSRVLLEDRGDGAEVDLLGTTPPRSRIRNKEKRRTLELSSPGLQKTIREKRSTVEFTSAAEANATSERLKKRASLKLVRAKERDWKQEMGNREPKTDSLPSPSASLAVPTLVESCSRFMSLSSRPLSRSACEPPERARDHQLPASRVSFHNTFSMLINMGNVDKACRRTISREEQVWQNELKDLIWLELQAKIAGRTLTQQDAYLCAQRNIVPTLIKNISEYRFVNPSPCERQQQRLHVIQGSCEDVSDYAQDSGPEGDGEFEIQECVSFECSTCAGRVGRALREVGSLLDSMHAALALYPSTQAMTLDHPLIAADLFKNRIKAMCLWYNTALNLRLKMLSVRRILRSMQAKGRRPQRHSMDSGVSRQSSETTKSRVHFDVSPQPTDSSNSDSSALSEHDKLREDELDSGVDTRLTGQVTPEIVVSEARPTPESMVSNESECGASEQACIDHVYDIGPLDDLAHLRLLDKCSVSVYREYHCEILKTQGVRRSMTFIDKMRKSTLNKAYLTLEKPDTVIKSEGEGEDEAADVFKDPKEDEERKSPGGLDEEACKTFELKRYGWWSPECGAMRLPSYRGHFLLLASICMEAVHDYLAFRLESRPDKPSCLTVKQLIHELKEGLDIASEMRSEYVRYVRAALAGRPPGAAAPALRLLLATFHTTVEAVLKQYLSYLRTMSETEQLSRACLQQEWGFTARLARRIHHAAVLAPPTFSSIACNQLNRLLEQYKSKFNQLHTRPDSDEPDRYTIYAICRSAQSIYACSREGTLGAAQWARALAARLARAPPPAYLALRGDIFNSMMAIRDVIALHTEFILEKSGAASEELEPADGVLTRIRELLLQIYKLGFELHKELYKYAQAPFVLLEEKVGRKMRPTSLQPQKPPTPRPRRRPETMVLHDSINPLIHRELHKYVNDSVNHPLVCALSPRRSITSPLKGCKPKFTRSDSIVEDYETNVFEDKLFDNLNGENQASLEQVLPGSGGAAGVSDRERQWAASVARAIIDFAKCWMRFVVERCDRGRGLRPRWASQGLEFLMLACDPCNTTHLSDEEFEELKQLMDGCISHVVGSRPPAARAPGPPAARPPGAPGAPEAPAASPRPRHRLHSPLTSSSASRDVPTPPTPPSEPEPLLSFKGLETSGHSRRVLEAVQAVDRARDEQLRGSKAVGAVRPAAAASYEPKLRQLTFKWQRGLKIGAGTFGKVYTVVNTESGQLLAMKELSIGAGDRRALQRAANELRVLEGVLHPHLVRYYGCELHREEMLLFMELCVEGSLEALVATAGQLPEHTIRRYTKQLISAVAELHARNIAHRDIKSGNIFLTNEGNCLKLGDFGCAVKIRANTTAPGELQGFVGTQAYMAPEVFMAASGHGRAADIWSVGCVVTEMASGKRPFPECDSNYQIMFVVGMGGRPHIAPSLSPEGQELCLACLTHDPDLRPRAETLALHHFLMINSDDDCQCEPSYLIT